MKSSSPNLCVAVVTGGHPFSFISFQTFWEKLPGVRAYIQHLEQFAAATDDERALYDAVVFYNMTGIKPVDDDQPWWAGKPEHAIRSVAQRGQGIVVWHHALIAFPGWDFWAEVTGHPHRHLTPHFEQTVAHQVVEPEHPVTAGVPDAFSLDDEAYEMPEPDDSGNSVLLTTDHPKSLRAQAWVRECGQCRVLCLIPGHDQRAWNAPAFATLMANGLRWVAQTEA